MKISEFTQKVRDAVAEQLGEEYRVELREVKKNNGRTAKDQDSIGGNGKGKAVVGSHCRIGHSDDRRCGGSRADSQSVSYTRAYRGVCHDSVFLSYAYHLCI